MVRSCLVVRSVADLTTEFYWHCLTAEYWTTQVQGSKGTTYTVRFDRDSHKNQFEVQYDWSCTCIAYQMQSDYCKHIKQVQKIRCGWMQFEDGGEPIDGKCPKCGSEIASMGYKV